MAIVGPKVEKKFLTKKEKDLKTKKNNYKSTQSPKGEMKYAL